MDHKRADAILQEVAQFAKGDFLINDDSELTTAVARKFARKSREYLGGTQSFGWQRMSCTPQCTREQGAIVIFRDGVVFGPYCALPAGKYIASFYVENAQKDCGFIVESQQTGIICSAKAGEVQLSDDGAYFLEFSLPQQEEQLELKVYNPTDIPVVFHKVTVAIPLGRIGSKSKETLTENIALVAVDDAACAALLEDLHSDQSVFARMMKDMGSMAECRPPHNTKHIFFKKVIRKVINSYVFFQVEFNKRLLQQQKNLVSHSRKMLDVVAGLRNRQNDYEMRLTHLEQDALTANKQLALLKELCNSQKEVISAQIQVIQDSQDSRIGEIWEKIKRIDAEFESVWRHNREANMNLDSIWRTYNTMRQELFYEIEHRTREATMVPNEATTVISSKILPKAAGKIEQQDGKIRLNLGSGNLSVDGYLNVDARELSNVDVIADVSKLPYEEGSVDEIFSAHLIEHFTKQRMEKELLPYWKSLLKTGGVFRVIFPDLEAMIKAYDAGEMDFNTLGTLIMGGQDYQLDYHYAVYSPEVVVSMLRNVGFRNIQIVAQGRENGGCRETEIVAIK